MGARSPATPVVADRAAEPAPAPEEEPAGRRPSALRLGVRWLTSARGVLALAMAVWGLRLGLVPLRDNSFLTHLATGRLILDDGIPRVDPYSFTAAGEPWVVQSWLASVLYAVTDRINDGYGLLALNAVLMVGLSLAAFLLTRGTTSIVPRLGLTGLALAVGSGQWSERPLLFGLLFIALSLLVVDGRAPTWSLVPAYALWVNLHGSFPLGLVLLAVLALGSRLDGSWSRLEVRAFALAIAGTLLGALGPLGPRLLLFPVELLQRSDVLSDVVEWRAPLFESGPQRAFLVQFMVAVVLLVRRPCWRTTLPLVVFGAASLVASRNIAVASLVLLPGMAASLRGVGSIPEERRSPVTVVGAAVLVGLAVAMVAVGAGRPAYSFERYPVRHLALLEGGAGSARLATKERVGNYLEATLGTEANVFYDDRFDMYPEDVSDDYRALLNVTPGWDEVLDEHDIDVVVWPRESPLAEVLAQSPAWHLARVDEHWVTVSRRSG